MYDIKRMVHDATETAIKRTRSDAARAERLRTHLGSIIGVVPDEHVTADEVGKYGLGKLGQELPDNGDHATAIEYYLAGRLAQSAGISMDAASHDSFVGRYLRGEA